MTLDPSAVTSREVVASYPDYGEAQRAVDHLADDRFPVERVGIIGSDLRMVETVLGRLTWWRAGVAGMVGGAWFGLLVGLLLAVFADSGTGALGLMSAGVVYGAVFGAVFGVIAHAGTGGRRDFASRSQIVAARYDVVTDPAVAADARTLLAQLSQRTT